MDEQETRTTASTAQADTTKSAADEPARRPWIEPTFERLSLKDATALGTGTTDVFVGCS